MIGLTEDFKTDFTKKYSEKDLDIVHGLVMQILEDEKSGSKEGWESFFCKGKYSALNHTYYINLNKIDSKSQGVEVDIESGMLNGYQLINYSFD